MTDTETLLRKAAMAAGYKPIRMTMGSEWPTGLLLEGVQEAWNSAENSGDALDLAVKLHLEIDHNHPMDNDAWVMARVNGRMDGHTEEIDGEAGRAAATRLAITRAAAAIYDSQQGAAA